MTRLEWSEQSLLQLERLCLTHTLPTDSRRRIEQSAAPLAQFPRLGPKLQDRSEGELRFLVGPWPWLVIVYLYRPDDDRLVVVSVDDGRAATATISAQRPS